MTVREACDESYDVAIVGYGPVGQLLAVLLAQRGWTVGVFEKRPAPYPLPRAVHFDHEVARIFQAAGVMGSLSDLLETADVYEWRNANGEALLRFVSRSAGWSGWADANMYPQPELERRLDARAVSFPHVRVHRGCEVTAIEREDEDGAVVVVTDISSAKRRRAHARFVVGCDGANSFVRGCVGATVTDLGFFFDWLIVDVIPHRPTRWTPLNVQICDPARPTTMVSGGRGRRRWEFMGLPGESLDELGTAATAWRLLAPWGVTPADAVLERHAVYRFQARWVDRWRDGCVLLAGDAAHQMPPFAGQGMCTGFRDAANLAWKLDLVLSGRAPSALLDTYASERIPQVSAVIAFSMELGKVICIADREEAAARDAMMISALEAGSQATTPPPIAIGPGVLLEGDPRAGQLFPQGRVRTRADCALFDDAVGRGWTLVSREGDPGAVLDGEPAALFAELGGTTAHVGPNAPVDDIDGTYGRWFADSGVAVVLQRPDFYVFGTAARLNDTPALVAALARALGRR